MAFHWLDQYGSEKYRWQQRPPTQQRTKYYRPLGLAETSFDSDGRYYEGRADINSEIVLELKTSFTKAQIRERILLAWTYLRCQHLLLQAKAMHCSKFDVAEISPLMDLYFTIDAPHTREQAIEDARSHLVFLDDHFGHVDHADFWQHSQNSARIIDPETALAKLFISPFQPTSRGKQTVRILTVAGHQIADGLAFFVWSRNLIHLLNRSNADLRNAIDLALVPDTLYKALPLPQEALYPPIPGSRARQRWFWLLTRILRYVRKPLPAGFPNPLIRQRVRTEAIALSPTYAPLLDYTRIPPLNAFYYAAKSGVETTQRLHRLCREAKASIGAGCFAIVALIMMEMYEKLEPNVPLAERRPFICGFPLNPRPFFNHDVEPNSLMLAFCDGIALPFLSSSLPLDGRIRLLARQAHRQLAIYQKRVRPASEEGGIEYMGSRGPGRMLALQYISQLERVNAKLPPHLRRDIDVQGAYPMTPNLTTPTCGVSSIGRTDFFIKPGMYDVDSDDCDFVADYRNTSASVRPRDGEFLMGCSGTETGLGVGVSVDGNALDPMLIEQWMERFKTLLLEPKSNSDSKL